MLYWDTELHSISDDFVLILTCNYSNHDVQFDTEYINQCYIGTYMYVPPLQCLFLPLRQPTSWIPIYRCKYLYHPSKQLTLLKFKSTTMHVPALGVGTTFNVPLTHVTWTAQPQYSVPWPAIVRRGQYQVSIVLTSTSCAWSPHNLSTKVQSTLYCTFTYQLWVPTVPKLPKVLSTKQPESTLNKVYLRYPACHVLSLHAFRHRNAPH